MSLSITADDNGSKEITVEVDGLSGGEVATILASKWNGSAGPQVWQSIGTITDPATSLNATLASFGAYMLVATRPALADAVSNVFYLPVVDDDLSLFMQCEASIVAKIQALNLQGPGNEAIGDRVYNQTAPHDTTVTYPCALVASNEGIEKIDEALAGSNLMSNIGHPFKVFLCLRGNLNQEILRTTFSLWRQTVRRAFDKTRLADVPSCPWTTVEFGPRLEVIVYPRDQGTPPAAYEILCTTLTIRCTTREPRGFLA